MIGTVKIQFKCSKMPLYALETILQTFFLYKETINGTKELMKIEDYTFQGTNQIYNSTINDLKNQQLLPRSVMNKCPKKYRQYFNEILSAREEIISEYNSLINELLRAYETANAIANNPKPEDANNQGKKWQGKSS